METNLILAQKPAKIEIKRMNELKHCEPSFPPSPRPSPLSSIALVPAVIHNIMIGS